MSDRLDYVVVKVGKNVERTAINRCQVEPASWNEAAQRWDYGTPADWSVDDIVRAIEAGKVFYTRYKDKVNGQERIGSRVEVDRNGIKPSLRTNGNANAADNLLSLPPLPHLEDLFK